ncbi:MAG: hypothetical protein J6N53_14050 [Lachnospiraceae bacterium]|nr:hypothetical protein [Lachnospiraceae bacterium]MBO6299955.1 hypothetical protein [Lachnospiraceae bacterium]
MIKKNRHRFCKIKYKTRRQQAERCAPIAMVFILLAGYMFAAFLFGHMREQRQDYYEYLFMAISIGGLCIGWFFYSVSGNLKRNNFKKNGICFPGYIIGAEEICDSTGSGTFFLLILFDDNGKKIKYSEAYCGDPNIYLQSRSCNIYRYKNKYIEADLLHVEELTDKHYLNIPITKYKGLSKDTYV